jgi:hypothetical protein
MPRSKAQKRAKRSERVRKGKMASGPPIYGRLSARDLDFLWKDFEKIQREAGMRAIEGISLDPRENERRRASQLPPPAPGYGASQLPPPAPG